MDTLELSSEVWRISGIYLERNCFRAEKLLSLLLNMLISGVVLFFIGMSAAYAIDQSNNASSRFYALFIVVAMFINVLPYIVFSLEKSRIVELVAMIRELVEERQSRDFSEIYARAHKIEKILAYWPIRVNLIVYWFTLTATPVLYLARDYYGGRNIIPNEWPNAFYLKAPFDSTTVCGFLIVYVLEMGLATACTFTIVGSLLLHVNPAIYIESFSEDFCHIFDPINASLSSRSKPYAEIETRLNEAVALNMKIIR